MAESERAQGGGPDTCADAAAASFELELPAVATSIATGRHAVRKFCDGHSLDHGKIAIAVSEALTNVVVHAYRNGGAVGPMRVSGTMLADVLMVVVSDDGLGMTPRTDSPGMGMGLLLIDQFAGTVQIDSDHRGTRLEMGFARGAGSHAAA